MKYCSYRGLFRPSCALTVATFWGVEFGPRIVVAGFPGSRCTRKNEATETKRMMMMSSTSLFVM